MHVAIICFCLLLICCYLSNFADSNKNSNKIMETSKAKEPIKLRGRKMKSGRTSLYLDIYVHGQRTYEYLNLYLVPEKTKRDREKNRETISFAECVKAKRIVELRNNEYGFEARKKKSMPFLPYFADLVEEKKETSINNYRGWKTCEEHLKEYIGHRKLLLTDITPEWINGFHTYLKNKNIFGDKALRKTRTVSQNTCAVYLSRIKTCLKKAHDEGLIAKNPFVGIAIKKEESTRMYLTMDEVRRLADTECYYPSVKTAFLFSCLTGLRRSDIEQLTWGEVQKQGNLTRLIFRQKKTGGQEYLDIAPQAEALMPTRRKDRDKVFRLPWANQTNKAIQEWVDKAQINKHISFHSARHTFAVMMLELGTDIYTVSKLLGHRELSTTQIYAKVVDKSKQEAVMRIPDVIV